MDLSLTLAELDRLETERKLRAIPAAVLGATWVLDAQVEAVIDALLIANTAHDEWSYAHARHTGEWAARIAAQLAFAPAPCFARRCGVLAEIDPAVIERVREVRECAPVAREFQEMRVGEAAADMHAATVIVAVAEEFDSLIFAADDNRRHSPNDALRVMRYCADVRTLPIIEALLRAIRTASCDLLTSTA